MVPACPMDLSTYAEVTTGSKQVVVIVKNLMAAPITITKDVKII